ncbi:DDE_Tnp_1_7 domain-containing protein [Trichonephila clavipes]|nr:DDE_Tnp_1_7 domain-containing protein [Trichonephila clavipes]
MYVPPLPADLSVLRYRMEADVAKISSDSLKKIWDELVYQFNLCRVTSGAHIQHLLTCSLDQLTFRIALARQLIDGCSSRRRKGHPASFQVKKCVVSEDVRLVGVGNHMPKMVTNCEQCKKCSRKGQEKSMRRRM